ncbi:MAG: hypothetical protein COV52_01055 [Gammaproteobacteria bacterium CG11_big_fil_rev_8_21_14_0_20_46_22]|nr:MAG: hypothetical protein COW05_03345 [Gammaproteobacteria bacterium CG12_big_fil_rev_8_21_14_0_65_46_12]PIR12006.1 MAG: hypothetical protein COV52_01055 [Gammaproteobacteria bacterium CG11_big_fil_rev_8_21_14_0_20_46_22]
MISLIRRLITHSYRLCKRLGSGIIKRVKLHTRKLSLPMIARSEILYYNNTGELKRKLHTLFYLHASKKRVIESLKHLDDIVETSCLPTRGLITLNPKPKTQPHRQYLKEWLKQKEPQLYQLCLSMLVLLALGAGVVSLANNIKSNHQAEASLKTLLIADWDDKQQPITWLQKITPTLVKLKQDNEDWESFAVLSRLRTLKNTQTLIDTLYKKSAASLIKQAFKTSFQQRKPSYSDLLAYLYFNQASGVTQARFRYNLARFVQRYYPQAPSLSALVINTTQPNHEGQIHSHWVSSVLSRTLTLDDVYSSSLNSLPDTEKYSAKAYYVWQSELQSNLEIAQALSGQHYSIDNMKKYWEEQAVDYWPKRFQQSHGLALMNPIRDCLSLYTLHKPDINLKLSSLFLFLYQQEARLADAQHKTQQDRANPCFLVHKTLSEQSGPFIKLASLSKKAPFPVNQFIQKTTFNRWQAISLACLKQHQLSWEKLQTSLQSLRKQYYPFKPSKNDLPNTKLKALIQHFLRFKNKLKLPAKTHGSFYFQPPDDHFLTLDKLAQSLWNTKTPSIQITGIDLSNQIKTMAIAFDQHRLHYSFGPFSNQTFPLHVKNVSLSLTRFDQHDISLNYTGDQSIIRLFSHGKMTQHNTSCTWQYAGIKLNFTGIRHCKWLQDFSWKNR